MKPKSFQTAKETDNKVKRQPMEWQKVLPNHTSDKGLISKIYRELIQFSSKHLQIIQLKNRQST